MNIYQQLQSRFDVIGKDDQRIESYSEDTMYRGTPEAEVRARDEQEVAELMRHCHAQRIPMTFCGSQTSMTGASVADEGLIISTERLAGIVDIDQSSVTARSGTIIADLQRSVDEAGGFFPVAPTSKDNARIGASVATNCTGEDSYKYGAMRAYVRRLKILLADGTEKTFSHEPLKEDPKLRNKAGYFLGWKNPIDLIVGSEGTLAFVTEVTLDLLPKVPGFFAALAPFSSNHKALQFIVEIASQNKLQARALELVDTAALDIMRTQASFPKLAEDVKALVYFKQEFQTEPEAEMWLEKWHEKLAQAEPDLTEHILIAQTHKEQESFRLWRHHIPQTLNERARKFWSNGGAKVGSDWWVPIPRLIEMMKYFYELADAAKLPYMAYAHLGSGHPHTNMLASNAAELKVANEMLLKCCQKAVSLGGGVAGEHGIGKIHRNYLQIQHSAKAIAQMKQWKAEYDPDYLLGRGNIF